VAQVEGNVVLTSLKLSNRESALRVMTRLCSKWFVSQTISRIRIVSFIWINLSFKCILNKQYQKEKYLI